MPSAASDEACRSSWAVGLALAVVAGALAGADVESGPLDASDTVLAIRTGFGAAAAAGRPELPRVAAAPTASATRTAANAQRSPAAQPSPARADGCACRGRALVIATDPVGACGSTPGGADMGT